MRLSKWLFFLVCLFAYLGLGYFTPRENFGWVFGSMSLLFGVYAYLIWQKDKTDCQFWVSAAVVLRLFLVAMLPNLSDDFYRFVWDGRLLAQGFSPYLSLPAQHPSFAPELFPLLNSQQYYTVYPPLHQCLFGLAAWLFPNDLLGSVIMMRLVIIGAEVLNIHLVGLILHKLKLPAYRVLVYALNPLIIIELTGNLHFEAVMLCFVLGAFYLFLNKRHDTSALCLGFGVAVKLIPLMLLPLLVMRLGWRAGGRYSFVVLGVFLLLFTPFFTPQLWQHFGSSLGLYFQKFELNASIYYLVRWWGYNIYGYNIIAKAGIWLSVSSFLVIMFLSFSCKDLFVGATLIITTYLLFTTTVHPWYLTTVLLMGVFTSFNYPMVWSWAVVISYHVYSTQPFSENLYLVAIEYLLVLAVCVWDLYCLPRRVSQTKVF